MKVKDTIQEIKNLDEHKELLDELIKDFKENDKKKYNKYFNTLNLAYHKLRKEKRELLNKELKKED